MLAAAPTLTAWRELTPFFKKVIKKYFELEDNSDTVLLTFLVKLVDLGQIILGGSNSGEGYDYVKTLIMELIQSYIFGFVKEQNAEDGLETDEETLAKAVFGGSHEAYNLFKSKKRVTKKVLKRLPPKEKMRSLPPSRKKMKEALYANFDMDPPLNNRKHQFLGNNPKFQETPSVINKRIRRLSSGKKKKSRAASSKKKRRTASTRKKVKPPQMPDKMKALISKMQRRSLPAQKTLKTPKARKKSKVQNPTKTKPSTATKKKIKARPISRKKKKNSSLKAEMETPVSAKKKKVSKAVPWNFKIEEMASRRKLKGISSIKKVKAPPSRNRVKALPMKIKFKDVTSRRKIKTKVSRKSTKLNTKPPGVD